jgi:hypothetical protein
MDDVRFVKPEFFQYFQIGIAKKQELNQEASRFVSRDKIHLYIFLFPVVRPDLAYHTCHSTLVGRMVSAH